MAISNQAHPDEHTKDVDMDRRGFLARVSQITLVLAAAGALTACGEMDDDEDDDDDDD
ncbi:MAG: hypothetical protein GVY22_02775 [Gammaproteobacteria bacterium]|jgi:hypothetical protein|nr:hypothetical protein [Gammaproteobacteria bacterium]